MNNTKEELQQEIQRLYSEDGVKGNDNWGKVRSANQFDRKVSGELHFADSKMQATLLFNVKFNDKGLSKLLGAIILTSDNFQKSSSDVTIYVKGKSK